MASRIEHRTSLQGLHNFMIHDPERDIQRMQVWARRDGRPRIHKFIVHGNKCDWLMRLPAQDHFIIRNVDISETPISSWEQAEALAHEHFAAHLAYAKDAESKGIARYRLIFEGRNEPQPGEDLKNVAHYEAVRLRLMHTEALRSCVFNWGVGNQRTYEWLPKAAADWASLEEAHREMKKEGVNFDILGLHFYWGVDGPNALWSNGDMRWPQEGNRGCQCPWMDVKIYITEGGEDRGVDGRQKMGWHDIDAPTWDEKARIYFERVFWAEKQWQLDPRIVGYCLFTNDYENNEWEKFDITAPVFASRNDELVINGLDVEVWGDETVARWRPIIEHRANQVGIDPKVIATIMKLESAGRVDAVSSVGAVGLMQVMSRESNPTVFRDRPRHIELLNPDYNVYWGCKILSGNLAIAKGNLALALCYYYGATSVESTAGKQYLAAFTNAWTQLWPEHQIPLIGVVQPPIVVPPPQPPVPTPTPLAYTGTVSNARAQEGGNWFEGTIYDTEGRPVDGIRVVFSWKCGEPPATEHVTTGPHVGYPTWAHGYYSHIITVGMPVRGNWCIWLMDADGNRISNEVEWSTDGPGGVSNQAQINFIATSSVTPSTSTFDREIVAAADFAQLIQLNKDAALQKRILADGFVPTSNEVRFEHDEKLYIVQRAEHLSTGQVRAYYCPWADFNNVKYVVRQDAGGTFDVEQVL